MAADELVLGGRPYQGVTDPVYVPPTNPGPLDRFALSLIRDPKDLPFIWLSVQITLIVLPCAALLFWPGFVGPNGWGWPMWIAAAAYLGLVFLGFLDKYILMLHNTSHRVLCKRKWMNHYIPWVLGPFMGESPETYFSHHIGMHHFEGNLEVDLSSTMRFQRDKPLHFVAYFLRFFFLIIVELPIYLSKRNRRRLAFNAVTGELIFWSIVGPLAYFVNWRAAVIVFVVPWFVVRFLMMAGNWGQHAFVDPARPDNSYVNSITCINARYNHRAFNDGYHIGHHLKQVRHYSDMPVEFHKNVAKYASEGAIVFEGIDFFMVWLYLMLGRFDWLADRYVRLDDTPRSKADIEALLRSRIVPCASSAAEEPGNAAPAAA